MIGPVAIRSVYSDLFGTTMLPVLEEIFRSEIALHPSRRDQLFKVVPWDRDIWQSSEIHDMDLFSQVDEGTDYSFKRPKQGANKTLTVVKYGLGFSISEEAVSDGKFDFISDAVRKLARSAQESQSIQAMNMFNNGFSTETTADGLSVFNSAHTLPSGGTFRNQISVNSDLSQTALDTGLADFETQFIGDTGIIYNLKPRFLVCHPASKHYAEELVGSEGKPDTADNNLNAFRNDGLQVVSSPHLTDTDAWFLTAEPRETGLRIIQRLSLETKAAGPDLGFVNDSVLYKSRYREKIGVLHPYGVYGSPGAP